MAIVMEKRDTEVVAKAARRRFTAEYKLRILREAEQCHAPGALGALLRREGLYSSHLSVWRRARSRGELTGLAGRKRGPKPRAKDERDVRITALERELSRWRKRAERAETLVEVQKSLHAAGHRPGRAEREELMQAVHEIAPQAGIAASCSALGLSRATYYRAQRRPIGPRLPRPTPVRALSMQEREAAIPEVWESLVRERAARHETRSDDDERDLRRFP